MALKALHQKLTWIFFQWKTTVQNSHTYLIFLFLLCKWPFLNILRFFFFLHSDFHASIHFNVESFCIDVYCHPEEMLLLFNCNLNIAEIGWICISFCNDKTVKIQRVLNIGWRWCFPDRLAAVLKWLKRNSVIKLVTANI